MNVFTHVTKQKAKLDVGTHGGKSRTNTIDISIFQRVGEVGEGERGKKEGENNGSELPSFMCMSVSPAGL